VETGFAHTGKKCYSEPGKYEKEEKNKGRKETQTDTPRKKQRKGMAKRS
jgi:hypothetical protein